MVSEHFYIIDQKTGGQPYATEISDGELEMVDAVVGSEEEVTEMLDQLENRYEQDPELEKSRLQSLDVYRDGRLYIDGTEYFTEQAGLADF